MVSRQLRWALLIAAVFILWSALQWWALPPGQHGHGDDHHLSPARQAWIARMRDSRDDARVAKSYRDMFDFGLKPRRHPILGSIESAMVRADAIYNRSNGDTPRATDPGGVIPVFAATCIGHDCGDLPAQFQEALVGVAVDRFCILLHGTDIEMRYWKEWMYEVRANIDLDRQIPNAQSRFRVLVAKERLNVAAAWNRLLDCGFDDGAPPAPATATVEERRQLACASRTPFVFVVNADLIARPAVLKDFARFATYKCTSVVGSLARVFSAYALNRWAYDVQRYAAPMGRFDEAVFPAYAEDDEYLLRASSLGLSFAHFSLQAGTMDDFFDHRHGGSASKRHPEILAQFHRWDKADYVFRKWGVDLGKYNANHHMDFTLVASQVFRYPWNVSSVPHNEAWRLLDREHRACIVSGNGPRLIPDAEIARKLNNQCYAATCDACFFNVTTALMALGVPAGEQVHALTTQRRVVYPVDEPTSETTTAVPVRV